MVRCRPWMWFAALSRAMTVRQRSGSTRLGSWSIAYRRSQSVACRPAARRIAAMTRHRRVGLAALSAVDKRKNDSDTLWQFVSVDEI